MIVQTFKTHCEDCGEELVSRIGDMTGSNEIIVDFMDDMEFECNCGTTTVIHIEKYTS
ncbi:hypothetical protein [Lederbergia galactosidilytica]|uniref:hypothetical protein n=1 Tax=Lederbergia galactosidilytica TaxID=217031 RepID=UPI000ABFC000|nr:hypothetical protein [Lederbergia galactosidilytica]